MTSRFPGPWRIAEFPNGFAVYDATGRQLGFFYGRADPNMAGHTGFLMINDARQIAVDFLRLPELLNQTSGRNEVPASSEDDKLEINPAPQCAPETSRLLRAAQLSVITVTDSAFVKAPTTIRRSISFEPDERRPPQMLRRPSDPGRMKFLILIAVAALPAGYLFFGDYDPPVNDAVVPQVTTNRLSAEFSPLEEAKAPLSKTTDITVESRIGPEVADSTVESPIGPKVQTAPLGPTVPLDKKSTENGIEARPPNVLNEANKLSDDAAAIVRFVMQRLRNGSDAQAAAEVPNGASKASDDKHGDAQTLPQKEGRSFTPSQDASTCFPSASAVRQNYPEGWASWTLRAPGHEGTRCWYPTKRTTAQDHRAR
jgi:hypothetical protein